MSISKDNIETLKIVLNKNLPKSKKWDEKKIWSFGYNKVLLGYLNAFVDHCPIKVSPNIIWQLILNAFAKHVNNFSEKLRSKFVNFEGVKNLSVIKVGSINDIYKYEDQIIDELTKKISENVGDELVNVLTPNFSTSTKNSVISGKVSIMSSFKKYFRYRGSMLVCGIPYILLEGTLEDWEKILEKLKFLSKYDFSNEKMEKDIEEIINTKKGKINLDFWRKIIMETKKEEDDWIGCGSEGKDKITGWILDFYNGLFETLSRDSNFVEEVLEVPIEITEIKGKKKTINGMIYAGIRDLKQDPETFVVEPIVNYCFSYNEHFSHFEF
jgi:hypothetical protein